MMRRTFFALPVGEGQDGAKTRNAVIESVEMDGVDSHSSMSDAV